MKIFRLRSVVDILTCFILIICMSLLPIFIVMTYKLNASLDNRMKNISTMFTVLEQSHTLNSKLILDTLEFRKIEYQCYLTKEAPDFLVIMDTTMVKYTEYINSDTKLTAQEKQNFMVHIEKIRKAVKARRDLTKKLIDYDTKRQLYLNNINLITPFHLDNFFKIINNK